MNHELKEHVSVELMELASLFFAISKEVGETVSQRN